MENITIKVNPITARLVADLLDYNRDQLEQAEKRDPYIDNKYLINAITDFLNAYDTAKNGGSQNV